MSTSIDSASTPVIELQGVTKSYGDLEVLKGIDLAVREHEAVALIGASGSGKSTILRCIDLLTEIDDGDIYLDGEVITDPSVDAVLVRRKLGLIFQAYNLFPHLTVIQNIVLGIHKGHDLPKGEATAKARSCSSTSASAAARTTGPTGSPAASSARRNRPRLRD